MSRPFIRHHAVRPVLLAIFLVSAASGQTPSPAPPAPTPVPKAEIIAATEADLRALPPSPSADSTPFLRDVRKRLSDLGAEMQARTPAANRLLHARSSGALLQSEEVAWTSLKNQFTRLKGDLRAENARVDKAKDALVKMRARWLLTQKSSGDLPGEIADRIRNLLGRIDAEDRALSGQDSALLRLQNDEANQEITADKTIAAIDQARKAALDRLTQRDSPPFWEPGALGTSPSRLGGESESRLDPQLAALAGYLRTERGGVLFFLVLWIALMAGFRWARTKARDWVEKEPRLARSTQVFAVPIAAASLVALIVAPVFFPDSPRLFTVLLGAVLVLPLLVVIRRLVEPALMPLTWGLAIFYLTGQFREVVSVVPVLSRIILLAETITAAVFAVWLVRILRRRRAENSRYLWRVTVLASNLAGAALAFATGANLLGYVNLSLFLTHVILDAAFVAVLLYATVRIVNGLATFALCLPPLSLTAAVRDYRGLLERRCSFLLHLAAVAGWLWFTLEQLSLRKPVADHAAVLLNETLKFGPVTLAGVLEFALTVWAAFLVSRFVRFLLDEEVFRRVRLAAGMPFAISTLLHYAILFVGFYLAAAILVGDMTKFTILAGAFSVGIGFGLQNVVNNFVSGIIVLFERPVKLGDVIQVGADVGVVRRIGIRATVIQTESGSELIVPNGKLIADPVTNWTLSDHLRRIDVSIATPASADPRQVIDLLVAAAVATAEVRREPRPKAELVKISGGTLHFELRASTAAVDEWLTVRSDLTIAVNAALRRGGIPLS